MTEPTDREGLVASILRELESRGEARLAGALKEALAGLDADRLAALAADLHEEAARATKTFLRSSPPGPAHPPGSAASTHYSADDPTPPPVGHVLLEAVDRADASSGRYTLTRLHAKGGLGQVWLARDVHLDRDVAFKEIRPEQPDHPEVWARFLREARITGRLAHPGIVPVYELSDREGGGMPFYTMRFVAGRTLRDATAAYHEKRRRGETGPLDLRSLLDALVALAHTVAYAHSQGVIHRDLKGDNVVLGDFGEVILLDWGLAKSLRDRSSPSPADTPPAAAGDGGVIAGPARAEPVDPMDAGLAPTLAPVSSGSSNETLHGQVLGTPAYMSPEQAAGRIQSVDERSDIYGLGAVMFEILTGQPPFVGATASEVVEKAMRGSPPRPRSLAPETAPELEAICLKALEKRPEDRYASAAEFADDARRFLADEPVSVYSEPMPKRLARWSRRHKSLVASAAVLLVTAVLALSTGNVLLNRKQKEVEREKARAESNFTLARDAVDRYLTRVGESPDLKSRGLEGLRFQLLDTARQFYETFSKAQGNSPDARAELGSSLTTLGNIARSTGRSEEAEAAYRRGLTIYDALLTAAPGQSHYRTERGILRANYALLLSETSRLPDSEKEFRAAIEDYEALLASSPGDDQLVSLTASAWDNFGNLYLRMRKANEAEEAYRNGLSLRSKLFEAHTGNDTYCTNLIGSHVNLGVFYASFGRPNDAEPILLKAIPLAEALAKRRPDPENLNALAACHGNLAGVYMLQGRLDDSAAEYRREMEPRVALVRDHPLVTEYRLFLGSAYTNLGELETRAGRPEEALPPFAQAIATIEEMLAKEPRSTVGRFYISYTYGWRARALGALGRHAEAVSDWDRAISFDDRKDATLRDNRAKAARGEIVPAS